MSPRARYYKTLFIPALYGQFKVWRNDLTSIAVKVDEIIQLGNLVGCDPVANDNASPRKTGPNASILSYVELWRSTYDNWIQLIGPNEIMALNFPDAWTNMTSNKILRSRWFEDPDEGFKIAAVSKGRLVTHGGLTHGLWKAIGSPTTAEETAAILNEKYYGTLYQGQSWALGDAPNFSANPIFADALRETYPSWVTSEDKMPFSQIHAGNSLNTVDGKRLRKLDDGILQHLGDVQLMDAGSVSYVGEKFFIGLTTLIPTDKLVNRLPPPSRFYVERIPVIDLRSSLFEDNGMEEDSNDEGDETSVEENGES